MKFDESTRILVVAAHPDDEVLGCGGTLAKARNAGAYVAVVFLGEGVSARFPLGEYSNSAYIEELKLRLEASEKALRILDISDVTYGDRWCCQFDTIPQITLIKEIEGHIDRVKPNILFTHNPVEVNVDHVITYQVVEVACRPNRPHSPNAIYGFEVVCSGRWVFDKSFSPNVYVDIEETWDKKLEAWNCYYLESRPFPFPRSIEGLEALAKYRGMDCNLSKAEGFSLLRNIVR
jgi:LmbE family N-acetylglucosaminyl deacetylase